MINPNNPENAANVPFLQKGLLSWKARAYSPPLNLCMVAAYTPNNIDVSIIDECVQKIDFNQRPDLVGLTAYTNTAPRAYEIADSFSKKGIPVVMGGVHASTLPEEALGHCDALVIGEAEGSWRRLIEDFRNGGLQRIYQNDGLVSLENLPLPRRDLLRPRDYVTINTVQTARGCPHNCIFCSVTRFNGKTYRFRPIEEVVEEFKSLPSRDVFIIDDNIYSRRERTMKLLEAMIPLGMRWGSQCTISIARDREMLELARESGCIGLAIGLESFSPATLKGANKGFNDPKKFHRDIRTIKEYGIMIWGSFVFGFDQDDEKSLEMTIREAGGSHLDFACFNFLTPLPGTKVYDAFEKESRVTDKNWSDYNMANVVFQPHNLTPADLEKKVRKAWLKFYSLHSVFKRLSHPFGKVRIFIWFVNLALWFYTRKKLLWKKSAKGKERKRAVEKLHKRVVI